MLARKKRVFVFFAIIYVIFISVFLYLLFFNSGLTLDREITPNGEKLFLSNEASHIINNIDIIDEKGNKIGFIAELKPKEKKVIEVPKEIIKITANAPWHVPVSIAIIKIEAGVPLNLSANYPKKVKVGTVFKIYLEICSDKMKTGEIETSIASDLLKTDDMDTDNDKLFERTIAMNGQKCINEDFEFEAIGKGTAQIIFKLKALNTIKELKVEMVIE